MTKIYTTRQQILSDRNLTRGCREGLINTMAETGGPVYLDGKICRPYQQITQVRPMGMHFATDAEERAITHALGEDQVIDGEVWEPAPSPRQQSQQGGYRGPSAVHMALASVIVPEGLARERNLRAQERATYQAAYRVEEKRLGHKLSPIAKSCVDTLVRNNAFDWGPKKR